MTIQSLQGHCDTCEKRNRGKRAMCAVLIHMIGLKEKCWAWSDDPDWWRKTQAAGDAYEKKKWEEKYGPLRKKREGEINV